MFEKGFLQDVRHNLWEICPDEGGAVYFPTAPFSKLTQLFRQKKKLYIQSILCYNFLVEVVVYKVAV